MEGLVSFLLFAALFYVMMRFGCGAHMVHGHGGGDADHAGRARRHGRPARDPVCGMDVAADQGYTTMYQGREYRLCSRACLDRFEANPKQYALTEGGA